MATTPFDRVTAERFLPAIGYDPPDFVGLEVRLLKAGATPRIFRPNRRIRYWEEIEKAQAEGYEAYYGASTRGDGSGGGKESVVQATTIWADVDAKVFDPSDFNNGKILAYNHIKETLPQELWPTVIVDSGRGFHLYWLLASPYAFDQDGSREYFEDLLRRTAQLLKGDPAVAEIARVMRLPGTLNLKDPDHPLPCQIIEANPDRKYTIDDIDKAIPEKQDSSREGRPKAEQKGGKASPSKKTLEFLAFGADEGSRNNRAFEAAADLAGCGYPEEEALEKIMEAARRCGLPEAEARNAVRSAYSRERTPSTGFSASPPPSDATEAVTDAALNALPRTDAGQAEAFALLEGDRLRFVHEQNTWFKWDGQRWAKDINGEAQRAAIEVARRRQRAALNFPGDDREKVVKWCLAEENKYRLDAARCLAKNKLPIAANIGDFDRDPWLVAFTNGVLDLRTGLFRPGKQSDMITLSTCLPYIPDAQAPRWKQFLNEIFAGDQDRIAYLQRVAGYCLSGSTNEQCFFILYGSGANGKSTFLNTLLYVYGEYGKNTPSSTVIADPRGPRTQTADLADLRGVRLVISSEVSEGVRLDEGRVKAITGSDPVTCRHLYENFMTIKPEFKLFLAVNHKPLIRGTDEAIWRRIHLIPFEVKFLDGQADKNLTEKLAEEAPGILAWAVEGSRQWLAEGLKYPSKVREATRNYREESDTLGAFLEDCTVPLPGSKIRSSELYQAFIEWCGKNGLQVMSKIKLSKLLQERGIQKEKRGSIYYLDLGLRPGDGESEEEVEDVFGNFAYNK